MKKITITLYRFEELPEMTQKQVTQKLSHINADYSFWYEYSYDHFKNLCALLGITIEPKSIHFKGFYSQGDGSSFQAQVDLVKLVEAVKNRAWIELMPGSELVIQVPDISPRLFSLIKKGVIDVSANVKANSRSIGITAGINWNYESSQNFSNIDKSFSNLESWFQKTAETLNGYLYKSLQAEYEYVTGEQSVAETIMANEYLFTADGEPAFHLEALAEDDWQPLKQNTFKISNTTAMHVKDSHDQHITVTDLTAAIKQAALFKQYRHRDAISGKRDDALKFYWTDLHTKLLKLQAELDYKV